jgi:hypothetical protein
MLSVSYVYAVGKLQVPVLVDVAGSAAWRASHDAAHLSEFGVEDERLEPPTDPSLLHPKPSAQPSRIG